MMRKSEKPRRIKSVAGESDAKFELYEARNPIPWQVYAIALALAVWGAITLITSSQMAQSKPDTADATADAREQTATAAEPDGRQLFVANCATCHQNNGAGIANAVPPLVGSRYALADPQVPVNILLFGIHRPIEVAGDTYNGRMPTFGPDLDDDQIAAILSYVRSSWGHKAPAISADEVAEQRQRFADRDRPWAGGAELARVFDVPASAAMAASEETP